MCTKYVCMYIFKAGTYINARVHVCLCESLNARTHAYTHLCLHSLMYILPYVFMYVCMNVGRYLFILHSFIYLWMHVSVHIGMNVRIHICTYVLVNACMLHSSMYAVVLSDFLLTKILFWQHYAGVRMCFSKFLGSLTCTSVKKGAWCLCANTIFTLYYVRTVKFVGFSLWTLGIFIALIIPATLDRASNRKEYQGYLLKGKCGRCIRLSTLLPSCTDLLESLDVSVSWNPNSLSRQYMYQFFSVEATRTHSDTHSR